MPNRRRSAFVPECPVIGVAGAGVGLRVVVDVRVVGRTVPAGVIGIGSLGVVLHVVLGIRGRVGSAAMDVDGARLVVLVVVGRQGRVRVVMDGSGRVHGVSPRVVGIGQKTTFLRQI
jgi:hypothetical protein